MRTAELILAWIVDSRRATGLRRRSRSTVRRFLPADVSALRLADELEVRVLLASDFGDAPASYPVTIAQDGARHTISGPRLGGTVDAESDGIPSANADADGADEDGIVIGQLFAGQTGASVIVRPRNAPAGTMVDGWIDFNADGDWADVGEKVLNSVVVSNGLDQAWAFDVPASAVFGTTYSRFRISTAGGLNPTGAAANGEVEDYKVSIGVAAPVITAPAQGAPSIVDVTGTNRVTFQWTAAAQAVNYEIFVSSFNYQPKYEFHSATVSGTSYTPGVDFGAGNYRVWMRSVGVNNVKSAWSPARDFTVISKTTFLPLARLQNSARPTLNWNAALGAESYKIWISNLSTGQGKMIYQENIAQTSFTHTADMPLGLYRAWVQVVAAATTSAWSVPVDFQVAPSPVITAGQNSTFDRTPTFAWQPVLGAANYQFQLRNLSTNVTVLNETVTQTSFTPSSNLPDGPYRWWVRAASPQNVTSLWTVATDIYVGGRPDVLTPTGTTSNSTPTFTWRTVDGAVRYELFVARTTGGSPVINKTDNVSTSYTPATALAAGNYRIWVRAVAAGNVMSVWSTPVNFTIAASDGSSPANTESSDPQLASALQNELLMTNQPAPASELIDRNQETSHTDDATSEVDVIRPESVSGQESGYHVSDVFLKGQAST